MKHNVIHLHVIEDVINRKIDDPGAGECHFENYLAQIPLKLLSAAAFGDDVPVVRPGSPLLQLLT